MKRKILRVVVIAIILPALIMVGLHIVHRDARANNVGVLLTMDWNGFTASNCDVTAELLDGDMQPFDPHEIMPLNANSSYTWWWGTFEDIQVEAEFVQISWTVGLGDENMWIDSQWDRVPPMNASISETGSASGWTQAH